MGEQVWFQSNNTKLSIKEDVFCRNGVKIEGKENEREIDKSDFIQLITNDVQRFINQSFDHVVVLVGAGASVTTNVFELDENKIAKSGVTVAAIASEVLQELESKKYILDTQEIDVWTLQEVAKKTKYSDNIVVDGNKLRQDFNLEDFLSNLFAFEKFVLKKDEKKLNNTKKAILDVIKRATSYEYDDDQFKHVKFLKIISGLQKNTHKLNVVTTNYDTLLEDAAERMKWTVFDGFSFSQTPQFDATMFDWNLVKDVPNVTTNEHIYKNNVMNLLKIHGSLTWERHKNGDAILRKNKKQVENPIMVFPSSDKYSQSYQVPYFELFAKFQELLKSPNTLLITTGFSFADNHISQMITTAIKNNDGLATLITDYNIDSTIPNWLETVRLMNNSYNVAFLKATMNDDLTTYLGGELDED